MGSLNLVAGYQGIVAPSSPRWLPKYSRGKENIVLLANVLLGDLHVQVVLKLAGQFQASVDEDSMPHHRGLPRPGSNPWPSGKWHLLPGWSVA
jgi:hypothetical protein